MGSSSEMDNGYAFQKIMPVSFTTQQHQIPSILDWRSISIYFGVIYSWSIDSWPKAQKNSRNEWKKFLSNGTFRLQISIKVEFVVN